MEQPSDLALQFTVTHDVRLSQQERKLRRERCAAFDQPDDGVDKVVQMQEGLPGAQVAGIDASLGTALVDPGDLAGEEGVAATIIIHAGGAEIDHRDLAPPLVDQPLGFDLRGPVRQLGIERPVLVNVLARRAGCVHQHRADKHELLDLEGLQRAQQPFGAV